MTQTHKDIEFKNHSNNNSLENTTPKFIILVDEIQETLLNVCHKNTSQNGKKAHDEYSRNTKIVQVSDDNNNKNNGRNYVNMKTKYEKLQDSICEKITELNYVTDQTSSNELMECIIDILELIRPFKGLPRRYHSLHTEINRVMRELAKHKFISEQYECIKEPNKVHDEKSKQRFLFKIYSGLHGIWTKMMLYRPAVSHFVSRDFVNPRDMRNKEHLIRVMTMCRKVCEKNTAKEWSKGSTLNHLVCPSQIRRYGNYNPRLFPLTDMYDEVKVQFKSENDNDSILNEEEENDDVQNEIERQILIELEIKRREHETIKQCQQEFKKELMKKQDLERVKDLVQVVIDKLNVKSKHEKLKIIDQIMINSDSLSLYDSKTKLNIEVSLVKSFCS